jgi:hypothetical protein
MVAFYRREKSGQHGKRLDALLMEVVNALAADQPLRRRNVDHLLAGGTLSGVYDPGRCYPTIKAIWAHGRLTTHSVISWSLRFTQSDNGRVVSINNVNRGRYG